MFGSRRKTKDTMVSAKEIRDNYNITYQTVNHYTNLGLLSVKQKRGNVRFYDKALVEKRLRGIQALAREGYSLRLIRKRLIGI